MASGTAKRRRWRSSSRLRAGRPAAARRPARRSVARSRTARRRAGRWPPRSAAGACAARSGARPAAFRRRWRACSWFRMVCRSEGAERSRCSARAGSQRASPYRRDCCSRHSRAGRRPRWGRRRRGGRVAGGRRHDALLHLPLVEDALVVQLPADLVGADFALHFVLMLLKLRFSRPTQSPVVRTAPGRRRPSTISATVPPVAVR